MSNDDIPHPSQSPGFHLLPQPLKDILVSGWEEWQATEGKPPADDTGFTCEWDYAGTGTPLGWDYEHTAETDAPVGSVVKLYGHDVEVVEVDDEWTEDEDTGAPRLFRSISVRAVST